MSGNQDLISVTLKEFKNLTIRQITNKIQESSGKHFVVKKLLKENYLNLITENLNRRSGSSWECSLPTQTPDNYYEGWIWSQDIKTKPIKEEKSWAGDVKNKLYLQDHQLFLTSYVPHKIEKQNPLKNEIRIASWNAENLDFKKALEISDFVRKFIIDKNISIIAIQEIVAKEADDAIKTIVDKLNNGRSKSDWNFEISERNSKMFGFREKGAFIWNSSLGIRVKETGLCSQEFPKIDPGMQHMEYSRRPFYGIFKVLQKEILLVSVHVICGNFSERRREEVKSLPLTVGEMSKDVKNIFILGDFNLEPHDRGFDKMRENGYKNVLNTNQKTNGVETKNLDNIWYKSSNIFEFHRISDVIRKEFDKIPSDHCPVWAEISIKNIRPEQAPPQPQPQPQPRKKIQNKVVSAQQTTKHIPQQQSSAQSSQFICNDCHADCYDNGLVSHSQTCTGSNNFEENTPQHQQPAAQSSEFICPNCGRDCHAYIGLYSHLQKCSREIEEEVTQQQQYTHQSSQYICSICRSDCLTRDGLYRHSQTCAFNNEEQQYYWSESTPQSSEFICPNCGRDCHAYIGLYSHLQKCSREIEEKQAQKQQYAPQSSQYICRYCRSDCLTRDGLYRHSQTCAFNNERQQYYTQQNTYSSSEFVCPNCGRDCHARIGLYSHMQKCSREFEQTNSRRQQYSRAQSSEFICPNCGRDCHARIGLYSHSRKCKG